MTPILIILGCVPHLFPKRFCKVADIMEAALERNCFDGHGAASEQLGSFVQTKLFYILDGGYPQSSMKTAQADTFTDVYTCRDLLNI